MNIRDIHNVRGRVAAMRGFGGIAFPGNLFSTKNATIGPALQQQLQADPSYSLFFQNAGIVSLPPPPPSPAPTPSITVPTDKFACFRRAVTQWKTFDPISMSVVSNWQQRLAGAPDQDYICAQYLQTSAGKDAFRDWLNSGDSEAVALRNKLFTNPPPPPPPPSPLPLPLPAPVVDLTKYKNTIVQWDGDTSAQKTSWLVGSDLRRRWIPDGATFNCLINEGKSGPLKLPSAILDQLTDLTGIWATCSVPPPEPSTLPTPKLETRTESVPVVEEKIVQPAITPLTLPAGAAGGGGPNYLLWGGIGVGVLLVGGLLTYAATK